MSILGTNQIEQQKTINQPQSTYNWLYLHFRRLNNASTLSIDHQCVHSGLGINAQAYSFYVLVILYV